jgi:Rieske Fe-S protein
VDSENRQQTRRCFLNELIAISVAASVPARAAWPQSDRVLAKITISENKELEKVGGFVLVKDTAEGDVLVIRTGEDQFTALSNVCPHKRCLVEVKSATAIQCPCHQSLYKIDGTYVAGPSNKSLRNFTTAVEAGVITVTAGPAA